MRAHGRRGDAARAKIFSLLVAAIMVTMSFAKASPASETPRAVPHPLAAATVYDLQGNAVTLGDTWKTKPVVLVFVRHFG